MTRSFHWEGLAGAGTVGSQTSAAQRTSPRSRRKLSAGGGSCLQVVKITTPGQRAHVGRNVPVSARSLDSVELS